MEDVDLLLGNGEEGIVLGDGSMADGGLGGDVESFTLFLSCLWAVSISCY